MRPRHFLMLAAVAAIAPPPLSAAPSAHGETGEHRHGTSGEGAAPRAWAKDWTRYPLILPAMKGGTTDRMGSELLLKNIEAPQLTVYSPAAGTSKDFAVNERSSRIEALGPKLGNFQWLAARQVTDDAIIVASTVHAFNNPGPAPTEMLLERKNELEIIPQPVPREHSSYRESEKWRFLVRFQGKALAGQKLNLETEFGTRSAFVTDPDGMATVSFPRDFQPAGESSHGGHGPRRAKFVLATEHEDLGKHYLTAFNYGYGADPDRSRSLAVGAGFGLLGMLLAAPLWRRKRDDKESAQ